MILGILQARASSSRLPGKVLKPLLGEPMLARQIERLKRSTRLDQLVVATSDQTPTEQELRDLLPRFTGPIAQMPPATCSDKHRQG